MNQFMGVYRGFAPTDESAVALGEIEATITEETIVVRMATGLKIEEERLSRSEFVPMTPVEVAAEYQDSDAGRAIALNTVGFRGDAGYPKLLFSQNPDGPELVVRTGGMGEMLGPTVLFSPTQVARGLFDGAIVAIEKEMGRPVIPRLEHGGKVRQK